LDVWKEIKMKSLFASLLALNLFALAPAFAADSAASASAAAGSSAEPGAAGASSAESSGFQKKFEENHEITDAALKATAGSLSQWSMRFNLSYYGPPVGDLGALDQPNPDGAVAATATAISGSIGTRYRLDPQHSISLTAGVSDNYPLRSQQKLDINNPLLTYDMAFKLGNWQLVSSPGISLVTQKVYTSKGEYGGLSYSLYSAYNLGDSGFALTGDAALGYYLFNRDYNSAPPKKGGDGKVRRINYSLYPGMKYNVNSKLNLNTQVVFTLFNPRSEDSVLPIYSRRVWQKVGVGYAITRDIYVNPYVQFYPSKMALDTTTINLSTVFSIL
jgi:hypothetical protein